MNEQCVQYDECDALKPFLNAGKAVLHIEYDLTTREFCPARPSSFSSLRKHESLDAWKAVCP